MSINQIIAVIREDKLKPVIEKMQEIGVSGVSSAYVKGYGEYINTYSRDSLVENVRLEVMINSDKTQEVVNLIMDTAHSGLEGDGIIAVNSLESFYRIRDKQELK